MRRKALFAGVVAAAAFSLSAAAALAQTAQSPPAAQKPAPAPPRPVTVDPKWQVAPQPVAPVTPPPLITPPRVRGYSQFDVLIEPREWPRQDHAFGNPETAPDRQDNDYGLDSVKAYDSTRPESPLGPY